LGVVHYFVAPCYTALLSILGRSEPAMWDGYAGRSSTGSTNSSKNDEVVARRSPGGADDFNHHFSSESLEGSVDCENVMATDTLRGTFQRDHTKRMAAELTAGDLKALSTCKENHYKRLQAAVAWTHFEKMRSPNTAADMSIYDPISRKKSHAELRPRSKLQSSFEVCCVSEAGSFSG